MPEEKTHKLKIDLARGLFEAEGSEEFVKQRFEKFEDAIKTKKTPFVKEESSIKSASLKKKSGTKQNVRRDRFSIVKDLNLQPKDKEHLKEFFEKNFPNTNIERNTVFVYYLQKTLRRDKITIEHIFTCYKEIGLMIPGNLKQSIVDTSSRYGYLDASNMKDIKVVVMGENLVEQKLSKKEKKEK